MATAAKSLDTALLSSGQNMSKFGQSITQIESPLQGAASGMTSFASGVDQLANPLGASVDGMSELVTSTEQLNGSITETGGVVTDAAGSITEFGGAATEGAAGATELATASTDAGTGVTELGSASSETGGFVTDLGAATGETNTVLGETNAVLTETVPALTDTNTALGETNTALTETVPALTDTNTALGDTGTLMEDTAGQTEGLNTGLNNVEQTTGKTAQGTLGLNSSMATLGSGMVGLVGAGVQLFNSYDDLGDAEMRVEQANVRLERSQTMLESKMAALQKTTNNMAKDSTLMVSGLNNWTTAQAALNQLVSQGVTSGAEWEAALKAAQTAQDAMSSSTARGNEFITQAGIQLDQAAVAARRVEVNAWQVTNAQEAQNEAWARTVEALVTVTGVGGSVAMMLSGAKGIGGGVKALAERLPYLTTSLTGLGGGLTALKVGLVAVGGTLAAVAIPIGVAIAALAAFVAGINALRVNIKVFDDMGKAIGSVFPQSIGFLNDMRQGFINLSDGTNTAVSLMLGGIDALTGGVYKIQEGWDKWTGTLPKGNGELGKVGLTAAMVAEELGLTNNSLEIAADKTKVVGGNLMDLNGNLLATAGNFDTLGNGQITYLKAAEGAAGATKNQSTALGEASENTRKYIPLAEALTQGTTDQATAAQDSAELNELFGQVLAGNIPALIQTTNNQAQAALSAQNMAGAEDTAGQSAEDMGGSLDVAAEGSANLGAGVEQTAEALTPMEQALAAAVNQLNAESDAAKAAHINNTFLLALWGRDIPDALRGSQEAVAGMVMAHEKETKAARDNLTEAYAYIEAHGGVEQITDTSATAVIRLAESLGMEKQSLEEVAAGTLTYGDALANVQAKREEEMKIAQDQHTTNLALLEDYGIAFPQALRGNMEAIQGIIDAHENEISVTDKAVTAAYTYLEGIGKIGETVGLTKEEVIALAESYGLETDATKAAEKADAEMLKTMADMKKEMDAVGKATYDLTTAVNEEGQAARDATEARRQQAIALGVYDEMVKLAIKDQQPFLDQTDEEITKLQELAKARGLDTAALVTNKGALQEYITTHERLPPTQQEVIDKYTELIAAKQDERFETELTRQALALYVQTQFGVADATNASKEQLETFITAMENATSVATAFADGLLKGKIAAMEMKTAIAEANGEYVGFREGLIKGNPALQKFGDLSRYNNEQLKGMAGAMMGSREAIGKLIESFMEGAASFNDFVTSIDFREIDDKVEEGVDKFRESLGDMVDIAREQGVEISDEFIASLDFDNAIQTAAGVMEQFWPTIEAAVATGNPDFIVQGIALFTSNVRHALEDADLPAAAQEQVGGIFAEIDKLRTIKDPVELLQAMENIKTKIVALKEGKGNLESMTTALTNLNNVPVDKLSTVSQSINDLATTVSTLHLELTPEQINAWATSLSQLTGVPIDNLKAALIQKLQETGDSATTKLLEAGPGGDAARVAFGNQMVALAQVMSLFQQGVDIVISTVAADFDAFVKVVQTDAISISGAVSNMATNTALSMNTMASGILIILAAFARIQTDSQRMASTVSGSFSNMSTNTISSMNKMASGIIIILSSFTKISSAASQMNSAVSSAMSSMASKTSSFASSFSSAMGRVQSSANSARSAVSNLASAINSLKSKSVTITVTTVYRTVYAAAGGAFVASSPTKIGPMKVAEFGQKELVTVTPLEGPGRNKIKGLGEILAGQGEKKGRRMLSKEAEEEPSAAKKEMVMMRETPIIIQIDGREITRVVNKRMFEQSDALV